MRNKFFISLLSVFLFSCSAEEQSSFVEVKDSADCEKPTFEEFKSSGLALLMRAIADDMKGVKTALEKGHTFPSNLEMDYSEILTTDLTDPSVKTEVFDNMAKSFLFTVDELKKEGNFNQENYNLILNSCMNCHEQYCPGPIVRIQKLRL